MDEGFLKSSIYFVTRQHLSGIILNNAKVFVQSCGSEN